MTKWPLGVFSSIDAGFGVQLEVAQELSVPTIQLHAPLLESRTKECADKFRQRVADMGIEITCVFAGFDGESYADIPTSQRTVGFVPQATRAARVAEFKEIADFADQLEVSVLGSHIGFVPHDVDDPDYAAMVQLLQELCGHCATNSQDTALRNRPRAGGRSAKIHRGRCP